MKVEITLIGKAVVDLTHRLEGQPASGADASAVSSLIQEYKDSILEDPALFIEDHRTKLEIKVEEA